jgi:hypothetical protein
LAFAIDWKARSCCRMPLTVTASRSFFELTSSMPNAVEGRQSEVASAPTMSALR